MWPYIVEHASTLDAADVIPLLSREVPACYQKLSLEQLVRADEELFTIMSQELQMKDIRSSDVPLPMDASMLSLRNDLGVTLHLLVAKGHAPAPENEASSSKGSPKPSVQEGRT